MKKFYCEHKWIEITVKNGIIASYEKCLKCKLFKVDSVLYKTLPRK